MHGVEHMDARVPSERTAAASRKRRRRRDDRLHGSLLLFELSVVVVVVVPTWVSVLSPSDVDIVVEPRLSLFSCRIIESNFLGRASNLWC